MSAQDRHKRQEQAPKPARRGPRRAEPAAGAGEQVELVCPPSLRTSSDGNGEHDEHTRAEEALRRAKVMLDRTFAAVSETVFVVDPATRTVVACNPAVERIFGYSVGEVVGRNTEFLHVDREAYEEFGRRLFPALDADGVYRGGYQMRRRDGSTFFTDHTVTQIVDGSGHRTAVVSVVRDITEHTRAEEALRESEERYRQLVELAPYAIAVHSEGKILFANAAVARLLGASSPDELIGKPMWDFIHPDYRQAARARTQKSRQEEGKVDFVEQQLVRLDGQVIDTESVAFPIAYQGKPARQVIVTDITERTRAEEALRQAEGRYRLLFEEAPVMYVITRNVDGVPIVTDCNNLFLATLGYPRAEVLGRPLADFYALQSRVELLEHGGYQRALEGRFVAEERQLLTRDGRVVETVLRAVPELDADGRTVGTRAMYLDITERKRAEKALRESEERFRRLAEASFEAIAVHDKGKILDANQTCATMFGHELSEIIGMQALDFAAPESRDLILRSILSRSEEPFEAVGLRKDGSTFTCEVRGKAIPYQGRRVSVAAIRDITDYRKAQMALEESERRYRLLAENASDIIWTRDLDLRIAYVNPAITRIRGYSVEEAMALSLEETLTPASLELARRALAEQSARNRAVENEPSWWTTLELEHRCKDGSTVWLEVKAAPLRDDDGRAMGILGVSRDISERKSAEEALQKTREELDSRVERRMRQGSAYGLTFRELTVLHLVVAGKSDKEIGAVLGISTLTASKHLANILHKMGAAGRTEAGVRALREGLLD